MDDPQSVAARQNIDKKLSYRLENRALALCFRLIIITGTWLLSH